MEANQNQIDFVSFLTEAEFNEYVDAMAAEHDASERYEQGEK